MADEEEKSAGKNHNKYRKEKPWDVDGIDHWSNDKFVLFICVLLFFHSFIFVLGITNGNQNICQLPCWRSRASQHSSPNIERNTFARFNNFGALPASILLSFLFSLYST